MTSDMMFNAVAPSHLIQVGNGFQRDPVKYYSPEEKIPVRINSVGNSGQKLRGLLLYAVYLQDPKTAANMNANYSIAFNEKVGVMRLAQV